MLDTPLAVEVPREKIWVGRCPVHGLYVRRYYGSRVHQTQKLCEVILNPNGSGVGFRNNWTEPPRSCRKIMTAVRPQAPFKAAFIMGGMVAVMDMINKVNKPWLVPG